MRITGIENKTYFAAKKLPMKYPKGFRELPVMKITTDSKGRRVLRPGSQVVDLNAREDAMNKNLLSILVKKERLAGNKINPKTKNIEINADIKNYEGK